MKFDNSLLGAKSFLAYIFLSALLFSSSSNAQSTLGELLDMGGTKIGRTEFVAMLPMTTYGVWANGQGDGTLTWNADGTFSGRETHYSSRTDSGSSGKWSMDENGKHCMEANFDNPFWSRHQECRYYYKLGNLIFRSATDSDRKVKIVKSEVKN